jgi:integrase
MKIKNFDKDKDNYIKSGKLYFNQYKTKDRYGLQVINIPKELNTLINKWKKINNSDYLLVNVDGKEFQSSSLSKKISRLFKGVGIDMLRSIFLSHYYKDLPKLVEMEELATKMGHSVNAAMGFYVKK